MSSQIKRFIKWATSNDKPEQPKENPTQLRAFTIGGADLPDYHVRMPMWMYAPAHGMARKMRNGETFNAGEMRLLGNSPSVWTCKKIIGDDIVACPWRIVPIDPKKPNKTAIQEITRFLQLGRRPNDTAYRYKSRTFNQVMFATIMDVLDLDAGVIVKVFGKNVKTRLLQIHSRDGSTILIDVDQYGILKQYWQYDYKTYHAIPLDPRELVYISMNPRSDSPYGTSPQETIRMVIRSLVKGVEMKELIHRKGGIPSGIMGIEGVVKEDFDAFKVWWTQKQASKVYKSAMINAKVNWTPLITSFKDLEFLETQKWFTELVYRTFKVPHHGIGAATRDVKGALPEQRSDYIKKTLYPILKTVEQHINQSVIPHFYDEREEPDCRFHYDILDVIEEAATFELWAKKFEWGAARINEYRLERGMEPLPWGDLNPSALKEIQQICQSWFYGAIDSTNVKTMTGLDVPIIDIKEFMRIKQQGQAAKPPPRGTGLDAGTAGERRKGTPRTDEERAKRHEKTA